MCVEEEANSSIIKNLIKVGRASAKEGNHFMVLKYHLTNGYVLKSHFLRLSLF